MKFDYCWQVNYIGKDCKFSQKTVFADNIDKALYLAISECPSGYRVTDVILCDSNRKIFVHNNFD